MSEDQELLGPSPKTCFLRLRVNLSAPASGSFAPVLGENDARAACLSIYPVTLFLEGSKEKQ